VNLLHSTELSLGLLATCTVKMTCLLGVAWIIGRAACRQSAAFRHLLWSLGILGSLMLPLLTLLLPAWHSATLGNASPMLEFARKTTAGPSHGTLHSMIINAGAASPVFSKLGSLALILWASGFLLVSMRFIGGIARLAWLSAHSRLLSEQKWANAVLEISKRFKITRTVRIFQCGNRAFMPLTWGICRPLIILPPIALEWPEDRRRIVICHELAHIARGDWFWQICAELACCFYWFHPFAWIAAGRLRHESERACDDSVLNLGIEASDYANLLLDLARSLKSPSSSWSVALALARPYDLERRFDSMLNPSMNRGLLSMRVRLLTVLSALCFLVPLAAVRLPAQSLSGNFSGTVHDPSGAAVPNATVIMTNHPTNKVEMTTSGAEGNFSFAALPAGEYEMKVLKPGFAEYNAAQIIVDPRRESSQNITLKVGAITEEVNVVAEGTPKPLAGEGMGKPTRVPLGGDIQAAKLLNKVQPVYPAAAKAGGIEGTVILHAVIGIGGNPLSLRVMNSQVDPELARAAVEAVSKWRYSPTLLNGESIEVDTTIMVNFKLLS
jgi:TonB family protein